MTSMIPGPLEALILALFFASLGWFIATEVAARRADRHRREILTGLDDGIARSEANLDPLPPLHPDALADHPAGAYLTDPDTRDADDFNDHYPHQLCAECRENSGADVCRYCGGPAEFDPLDLVAPVCPDCREHNLRYREDARHEAMLERAGL